AVERRIVEPLRDPRVARGHGLQEQEGRVAPSFGAPDARLHLARRDAHAHADPGVLQEVGPVAGEFRYREAIVTDALAGVSACPTQPHADHGQAEVVGGLDEVAGEDAEAPGVDREVLGEAELHAEVGDAGSHARAKKAKGSARSNPRAARVRARYAA